MYKNIGIMEKLLTLQNNFSKDICDEIFIEKYISNHLYDKWLKCDYNLIYFYSSLDESNKNRFEDWIINKN